MKKQVSKSTIFAALILSVIVFPQAMANCKAEVENAARAQDKRDAACNSASKSTWDKTLNEAKKGDSECIKKENYYKKAKERLQACTKK